MWLTWKGYAGYFFYKTFLHNFKVIFHSKQNIGYIPNVVQYNFVLILFPVVFASYPYISIPLNTVTNRLFSICKSLIL